MPKPVKENYVTVTLFKNEIKALHRKFDDSTVRLDGVDNGLNQKIDGLALTVVKIDARLTRVEWALDNTVATKADIAVILDRIDHVLKKVSVFDLEEDVQSLHLKEVREQVNDHEKRLTFLENR